MPNPPTVFHCALCERTVSVVTKHHLIPKSKGGREMVELCVACHKTLHSFFSNDTLLKELHSLETLRANPDIARYLAWVHKQRGGAIQVRRRRDRQ